MIKIEKTEVTGWEHAIRGMRNPKNSWHLSDSNLGYSDVDGNFLVGEKDYNLMTVLRNAGTDHRKFMRMIVVYADITAPLYWWKEYDTYKVGTVANSCSTMHKIQAKEFTLEDFSHENLFDGLADEDDLPTYTGVNLCDTLVSPIGVLNNTIHALNFYRDKFNTAKTKPMKEEGKRAGLMKKYWWQMIQLLPSSYNQKRTVMLNYEVLANQYKSRKNHKLTEWHDYCHWIESLPNSLLITGVEHGTEQG